MEPGRHRATRLTAVGTKAITRTNAVGPDTTTGPQPAAVSNAQCEQRNGPDTDDQDHQRHRIVIEPMSTLHTHDVLTLQTCPAVPASHGPVMAFAFISRGSGQGGSNPNGGEEVKHRSPMMIMEEIATYDAKSAEVLAGIKKLL